MRFVLLAAAISLGATAAAADPCKAIPDRGPLPTSLKRGTVFNGPVSYVGDGDSLCIALSPAPEDWVEVRLEDFYAPELHAPGGLEAKLTLERLTAGRSLRCRASHRSYDRIVATCLIGAASVGDLMRQNLVEGGAGFGLKSNQK